MSLTQVIVLTTAQVGRSPWTARDAFVPLPERRQVSAPAPRNAAGPYPPESSTYRAKSIPNGVRLTISGIAPAANTFTGGTESANIDVTGNLLLSAPGTLMLLGSSLIGLGLYARRRKTVILS